MLQVLRLRGGGVNALGRHAVAALLNAASGPDVSYDLSVDQVINRFNDVFPGSKSDYLGLKAVFEYFNEQGCPLNQSGASLARL